MHAERSGSPPFENVATTRSAPSRARATPAADVESPANDQIPTVGSNSVARDGVRSAYSIAGRDPAKIGVAPQPEGELSHDAYPNPAIRRRVSIQRCPTWGVAPARGRSTTFVGQAKLGLRGRPYTTPAVRQGRAAHPFHSATAGGVVGGEHAGIRASAECSMPTRRCVKAGERHE